MFERATDYVDWFIYREREIHVCVLIQESPRWSTFAGDTGEVLITTYGVVQTDQEMLSGKMIRRCLDHFGWTWAGKFQWCPKMSKAIQWLFLQSFQSPEVDLWYLWSRLISRKITSAACQTRVLRSPRRRFQLCLHCPRRGPVHQEQEKPHRTGLKSPYSAWFLQ